MIENDRDLSFVTKPTDEDYGRIASCVKMHRDVLEESCRKGRLFAVRYKGSAVAFMSYLRSKITAEVQYAEVKEEFRNCGIGGFLLENAMRHFRRTRIKGVELYSTSDGSFRHAERHGFTPFTKAHDCRHWMFRPLVDAREQNFDSKKRFVIWKNTFGSTSVKPDFSWSINPDERKPILTYCYYDWMVGIIDDGKIEKVDKMKYVKGFRNQCEPYLFFDDGESLW